MRQFFVEVALPAYYFLSSREYREFIRLLLFFGNISRYCARTIRFLNYKFFVPDCASFIWQFKEIFFEKIYQFETSKEGPVIYDCGANIGTSCLYFKKLYPKARIKAFEADPKIFNVLNQNLLNNNIKDVETFNYLVWFNKDKINFGTDQADAGSVYIKNRPTVQVEAINLNEWLAKEEQIDMLKMDIEGAEYDVILNCKDSLKKVKNLFIEYHSWSGQEQKLDEILKVLTENRFRYYFQTVGVRKTRFISKMQNLNMDFQLNIFAYRDPNK